MSITDVKPKLKTALLTANSLATISVDTDLTDALSGLNHNPLKNEGGIVLAATSTYNYVLFAAHGFEAKSGWSQANGSSTVVTPAGTFATRIGSDVKPKVKKPILLDTELTVVSKDELLDMGSAINTEHISGKRKYSLALMRDGATYTVVYATGSTAASTWNNASTLVSVGAMTGTAVGVAGHKPKAVAPLVLGNGYPVIDTAIVSDAASVLNAGDGTAVNFKRVGSVIAVYDESGDAFVGLYTPVGSTPTSGWRNILSAASGATTDIVPS